MIEKKNLPTTFQASYELHRAVRHYADQKGMKVKEVVERAIRQFIGFGPETDLIKFLNQQNETDNEQTQTN